MFSDHLARVRQRIQQACRRSGRDPSSVTLLAVTKGVPVEVIEQVVGLGVTDLGENRVQEARQKQFALGSKFKVEGKNLEPRTMNLEPVRWHLIGHLQRNKARDAVELFDVIHSLDSVALAEEVERYAAKMVQGSRFKVQGKRNSLEPRTVNHEPVEAFIQVNVSGEATKFGCQMDEAIGLARIVAQLPHLRLRGLMTLAPFTEDPEQARPCFRQLRHLRDEVSVSLNLEPSTLNLSMGMSQDFEVAIEEGADIVRIGSALFGARNH